MQVKDPIELPTLQHMRPAMRKPTYCKLLIPAYRAAFGL